MKLAMKMLPERFTFRFCKSGEYNLWSVNPVYPITGQGCLMWVLHHHNLKLGEAGGEERTRAYKP